ncbi:MAG: helix-turn-helix domain-containing protein [Pararobbsia sp.]
MAAYSIGTLSRMSGVNVETIRYYERVELLHAPVRAGNGYRTYDDATAERLAFIRRGRELGFALDEIRTLLDLSEHPDHPCVDADSMVRQHLEDVEGKIRDLRRMQKALRELGHCVGETAAHCRLVQTLGQPPARAKPPGLESSGADK